LGWEKWCADKDADLGIQVTNKEVVPDYEAPKTGNAGITPSFSGNGNIT